VVDNGLTQPVDVELNPDEGIDRLAVLRELAPALANGIDREGRTFRGDKHPRRPLG
jgi:hypothetical protein